MAHALHPDGRTAPVVPANGRVFTLSELQTAVGGYVEVVRLPDDPFGRVAYLVVNEDGKNLGLAPNALASGLLHMAGGDPADVVAGVALVVSVDELEGLDLEHWPADGEAIH